MHMQTKTKMKIYSFLPTEDHVRVMGRSLMLDDCRILSLSGSGVEFTYTGKMLLVTFFGDSTTTVPENEPQPWRDQARVAVIVDGITQLDTVIKKERETFVVCGDDPQVEPAKHTVRIIKLSEPRMSTIGLGMITIEAVYKEGDNFSEKPPVKPTKKSKKYIEFIGDSITCGYGADTPNELYPFSTPTENCSRAFAYRTAEKLGADYSLVSYSGHGIISGYTSNPDVPKLTELVPPYYELFSYSYNTFRGMEMQKIPWNCKKERKPDIIVINLGTNDDSYVMQDRKKRLHFEKEYVRFLEQVHKVHPKSVIVCAFGLMGDNLYKAEVTAVKNFKKQSGFEEVYNAYLAPQDVERNGIASCCHPSPASHEEAAQTLAEFIRKLGGKYAL